MFTKMFQIIMLCVMLVMTGTTAASAASYTREPGKVYTTMPGVQITSLSEPEREMSQWSRSSSTGLVFQSLTTKVQTVRQQVPIRSTSFTASPPPPQEYTKILISPDFTIVLVCYYDRKGNLLFCDWYS
jgi:acyl CoA:acetate/3-ketoacid CoA transferase alpha subunit